MIQPTQVPAVLTALVCMSVALAGCDTSKSREDDMTNGVEQPATPNKMILDEVNADNTWFHAKKTAPLWAKQLDADQTIQTLEGPAAAKAGDFLCRGAAGEFWPQGADRLAEKYDRTDEVDGEGFRKFLPKSEVMAAQVDHVFHVKTSWGDLKGKPGDFILKNFADKETEYPDSAWIVDKQLFADTYERLED